MIVMEKAVQDLLNVTVNKLIQTVGDNVKLVRGIDSEIMNLTSDIETFNARLVDSYKNPWANELQVLEVVRKKFQSIVNEAQDAVAKYISLQKKHEDNVLAKCFDKLPVPVCGNVNVCASKIQFIRTMMHIIRQDHEKDLKSLMNYLNNTPPPLQAQPMVEEDYVNVFEDDLRAIKNQLLDASNNFIVIPIVGMPGIGKTTFARKIFEDPDILCNKFTQCIWVQVSQNFNRKQKFIDILDQITKHTDDFGSISENRLEGRIKELLRDKKYFVVADDVWEKKDWNSLEHAFPKNSKGSRVLVTTRHDNVANSIGKPHTLKVLSDKESWSMLKRNVFGEEGCNMLFKPHGKKIAEKCKGMPLALTVVAGILRKYRTPVDWERVAENPFLEINRNDQSYHNVVMLSYHHLPHEKLKNCFLYFACFPMGHEIAAWKLIRLWIAEGFIPTTDDSKYPLDMEVEAKKYLNDLVDRNLVMVLEKSADGQIKVCRIHDSLHEFCKSEAAKKTLFYVMEGEQQRLDANTMSFRRLCFHSSIAKIFDEENYPSCSFFNLNQTRSPGERVHSLLFSSSSQKSEINLSKAQLAIISNTFQNLRVLDIESFESELLPNELYALSLLRYLAITTKLDILPKSIEKLGELVTLIFRTTKPTLEIKGSIWNMKRLMHLHTNTSTQLPSPPKRRIKDSGLHTLSVISPASCTKEIFSKTPNLKKLGVSGSLVELLDENKEMCMFNNLQMLGFLENLKLHGESERVFKVPAQENFPIRLRKLTLSNTLFEWNDMSILGSLEMLEVLKLDENAFIGEFWDLSNEVVFEKLQYLRIGKTNLVIWNATENSFPVLEHLVLRNCIELEEIPNAFAKAHRLKVMELFHVSENAAYFATNVCKQRHDAIDLSITSLLPQSYVYKQTQVEENVNISRTSTSLQALGVDESDVVGFDNEVKTIKNRLNRGSKKLKIVSIVGLKGLGKTILANMLYKDNEVQYEFFTRLWIDVSRPFDAKKTFRNILSELTNKANENDNMSKEQLAEIIKELLESEKYLIVMEDVWTLQDWDCLKIAFPNNKRGSRVLVTTRQHEVGFCADSSHNPHQLKFLNNEESWELLEKKVFCKDKCSSSLEALGRRIAENCKGVPHAVVSVANVLEKNKTPAEWGRLANNRFAIIDYMNQEENPLVQLIFDEMDFQLKDCFLYLTAFPVKHEISVRKLIRLWKAEGFIMLKEGGYTSDFEHSAEKYLEDLIDMNLLKVLKRRADGKIKTCCVDDERLYKFCQTEAAKKNLFHEIDGAKLEVDKNSRRLCVRSSVLEFLKSESKPSSKHVRSFLSSCKEEIDTPDENLATIPKSFPILRVVDIESLKLKSLPEELYHLDHLRYLAVSTDLNLLPEDFSHFQNMETLVLKLSQKSLEIKANIWSMPKLRHLCSNVSMQLPPPPTQIKDNSSGSNIETLKSISPSSCTGEILDMTPNLQKLGISGDLVELMGSEGGISLFDNLQKLRRLKNLKLKNESSQSTHSQAGRLGSVPLPQHNKFPQGLRKLTLWNTSFEWKDMSILGELNELEVLKLEEDAFIGKSWELNNVVFKQLQFLRIESNGLASWTTSHSCFPVLKTLELKHCHYLEAVPDVFADVESLKLLDLHHTNTNAAKSAQKIEKLKCDKGNAESSEFKISIHPPDH